jgi:hypothetical protein
MARFEYPNAKTVQIIDTLKSRNGSSDVTVVREGFVKDMVKVLDSMWASGTGNAVLRTVDRWPGDVYIVPRPGTGNPNEPPNSEADPGLLRSDIPFEPDAWSSQPNSINAVEALLHELVHSIRELSDKFSQTPTHDSYGDIEEYFAVMVGNVYRSETLRIGLRGGHGAESLPPKQRDDAAVFLNTGENRKRLEQLKRENGDLFKAVGEVGAKWNPFRLMTAPANKH